MQPERSALQMDKYNTIVFPVLVCTSEPHDLLYLSPDPLPHIVPRATSRYLSLVWFVRSWSSGPSIYDVHKKITCFTPPVHMRPHMPDPPPPLWTSTHGRHEIHTALLKWLVQ